MKIDRLLHLNERYVCSLLKIPSPQHNYDAHDGVRNKTMRSNACRNFFLQLARVFSALAILLVLGATFHEATGAMQRGGAARGQIDRILRRYDRVRMDSQRIARQVRETGEFRITALAQTFDIVLEPYDLRAPGYVAEEEVYRGVRRNLGMAPARTYRGSVPGISDSEARFTVTDRVVEGVILTPAEWYFVEPLQNFSPDADPSEMVVYRRSDINEEAIGVCGATLAERIGEAHEMVEPMVAAATDGIRTADVATEADYEYVTASGGAAQANATILDILNQVDGIYQTQLSVSLRVIYQHAWSTADDPYSSTAASTMLAEFRNYWNGNFSSLPYDLAHMWTGRSMDGAIIGVAYLEVVCQSRSYSYGVSERFTSSPGKYILTAHEIGHNFGASHPDQATPPEATCGNTIMNSYIGAGFTFCPFSASEIAAFLAYSSSCLTTGPAAPSNLTATAASSSRINLTWQDNSSDETGFLIERKTGAGGIWAQIGTAAANATSYIDNGLAGNTTYYYRVEATGAGGASCYSNEASATTQSNPPSITGIDPASGNVGSTVTIAGANLNGATAVKFNTTNAAAFTVVSSAQINATVPQGAATGKISVTTPAGTAESAASFTVTTCRCDINNDGSVNVLDIQLLINSVLQIPGSPTNCDINNDGLTNVLDLQIMINVILGISTCPG